VPPTYVHVPLAVNADGRRLAKRDGAVTRSELAERGVDVFAMIAASLGVEGSTPRELLATFDVDRIPREPWVVVPPT